MNRFKKIVFGLILAGTFIVSTFLLYAYTTLLDFFPWGDSHAYVVWEPLVIYLILPPMAALACVIIFFSKQQKFITIGIQLLFIAISFRLPSVFGFDESTDLLGRWVGVGVSAIATGVSFMSFVKLVRATNY